MNFKIKIVITNLLVMMSACIVLAQTANTIIELDAKISTYEVLTLDAQNLFQKATESSELPNFKLDLGNGSTFNLDLHRTKLISDAFKSVEQISPTDQIVTYGSSIITLQGSIKNVPNSKVALTLNDNFVYGYFKIGYAEYFIEPVYHLATEYTVNKFVYYNAKDVIKKEIGTCAADALAKNKNFRPDQIEKASRSLVGECFELEYNFASDFSMFQKFFSTAGVLNYVTGVMNNVQTNYDNEFADEVNYVLGQHFSSACSSCDPWSSSTDPEVLLNSFTSWGPSGFSQNHDLAGIWTNRNFDGSTIGVAWLNGLCNNLRYHALQDWGGSASQVRCMVAHEIGHNFGVNHDASGTWIMSPSVSTTNNWSPASISVINNAIQAANCLQNCPASGAPVADFSFVVIEECIPGKVQYSDLSINATSRSWSFPGGSPSTSTLANPLVTYNSIGTYNATLTVTNSLGSNAITTNGVITTLPSVVSNFTQTIAARTVTFNFTGTSGAAREWDFGDGNTSFEDNPVHTYEVDGVYIVTCTASNDCSISTKTVTLTIATAPTAGFNSNVNGGCQPLSVNFVNQSSSNSTSYLWTFPGGTPATSTQLNPTVNYTTAGNYAVTLKVTNSVGTNTLTEPNYINVEPLPVANFTSTQVGPAVQFTNMSQFSTSQSWSFGDGGTSTATNPNHSYTQNGTFPVILASTNACGTNNLTSSITIAQPPVASFTNNGQASNCSPANIQFTSTSTFTPTSYAWEFEGGTPSTSTLANPSVSYATSGSYDVRLVVTNAFGSSESLMTNVINVTSIPSISITSMPDGLTYQFNSTVMNGAGVFWNFGDGSTSVVPNPSHTYVAEGTYTVSCSAENGCGLGVATQVINVVLSPTAGFSTTTQTICSVNTIQFTNQSSPSTTSWLWTFEGGSPATSTDQNPIITYANAGNYDVSLTVSNVAGQNTNTIVDYITVNTVPSSAFQASTASNVITLTNTGAGATSTAWTITWEGGSTSLTGSPVTFTAPTNGEYIVIQTNSNACGTSGASTQTVNLNAYVEASMGYPATICEDTEISFVSTSINATLQEWMFEGANPSTSSLPNPSITYVNTGTYNITLIATNALGSDTLQQTVTIGLTPQAGFTYTNNNGEFIFTNTGNSNNVAWNFGDGSTSILENPSHTYSSSGTFTVTQIVTNSCGNDTILTSFTIIISGTEQIDGLGATIYPNPNNGDFTLKLMQQDRSQNIIIDLIDNLGRKVSSESYKSDVRYELSYQNALPGAYVLKIRNGKNVSFLKMIITK